MDRLVLEKIGNIKGIVQIGANTGQESNLFREFTKNVICFEPIEEVFKILKNNNPDFVCYNLALGDLNETKKMYIASNNGESSSFLKPLNHLNEFNHIHFNKENEMEVRRFDSLGINLDSFNVLISDTQGYEVQALTGFGNLIEKFDYIYTEYINSNQYENDSSLDKIDTYLKEFDFEIDSIYPEPSGTWGNVLFKKKQTKLETFIFVHDQQIILDFQENNKFKEVKNLKYVFVSNNPCDKIKGMNNVIIATDYIDNIEKYNKTMLAYTGWYLIWKNKLSSADYLNLFEYDINLSSNFWRELEKTIDKQPDVVGYMPLSTDNLLFLKVEKNSGPLIRSIIKNYKINPVEIIDRIPPREISVTFNHTLKKENFEKFMMWMDPIMEDIKEEKMAGHFPERALPFYYILNNLKIEMLFGKMKHFQMDTHDTYAERTKDFFDLNYDELLNNYKFNVSYDKKLNRVYVSTEKKVEVKISLLKKDRSLIYYCESKFDNQSFWYSPDANLFNIGDFNVIIKDINEKLLHEELFLVRN